MELDRAPARVTAAERDTALARARDLASSLEGVEADSEVRPGSEKPAFGSIFVDDRDQTWVLGVPAAGAAANWGVFGSDGRFLARVAMPEGGAVDMPVVRGGRMAVLSSANGYPEVIVYRLVVGGG